MAQFGFGSRTGIDISGESAGVLPSQEWKLRRFNTKWFPGETISIGIGQGYNSYTPVQLAGAIATIANDGVMYRPHIVNYVEDIRTRVPDLSKIQKLVGYRPEIPLDGILRDMVEDGRRRQHG